MVDPTSAVGLGVRSSVVDIPFTGGLVVCFVGEVVSTGDSVGDFVTGDLVGGSGSTGETEGDEDGGSEGLFVGLLEGS